MESVLLYIQNIHNPLKWDIPIYTCRHLFTAEHKKEKSTGFIMSSLSTRRSNRITLTDAAELLL